MLNPYPTQMSLWAALPASPGQSEPMGPELPMIAIYGRRCLDLSAAAGRDVWLLRMLMEAYHAALPTKYAWVWNPRITPQLRLVCQLEPLALHTTEIVYSLWPTPSATDDRVRQPPSQPHITKNGTLRHINKQGTQSAVRTSQAVRYWDGQGYENPAWKEMLMGLPPGWTDLNRPTLQDGPLYRAKHRKAMNRHVLSQIKALKTETGFGRSETRLYGNKYCRLLKRLKAGYRRKMGSF